MRIRTSNFLRKQPLKCCTSALLLPLLLLWPTWSPTAINNSRPMVTAAAVDASGSDSPWYQVPDKLFDAMYARYPSTQLLAADNGFRSTMWHQLLDQSAALTHNDLLLREEKFKKFHFPVFLYLQKLLQEHRARQKKGPLFVGISAPQGAGKTTLTDILTDLFRFNDLNCLAISIDDFYLTGAEQEELSKKYPHNRLLEFRGNAGTHDLPLLMSTLLALKSKSRDVSSAAALEGDDGVYSVDSAPVMVPRFDKSLRNGRGDRAPLSDWTEVDRPLDIVLLEGWMMGFSVVDEQVHEASFDFTEEEDVTQFKSIVDANMLSSNAIGSSLKEINRIMKRYEPLNEFMDAWLVLAMERTQQVYEWRRQAETRMRESGKPALTDEQVENFVARFIPAYLMYLPQLYNSGPRRKTHDEFGQLTPVLKVKIGKERQPLHVTFIERLHDDAPHSEL